ncbi:acyl carrier protein [Nocardia tengchongensis]|uniref:acyl carrier protein n=1 Tax=Nocardia tengchongensis TaxID=2055889 RepID=UPI0036B225CC
MDAAWIAVVGSTVAAVGSSVAAVITTWSARQQSARQLSDQARQWRREKRREAYANFLESGARARDELTVLAELAQSDNSDFGILAERIAAARTLTDSVRGFGARVLVEGPASIQRPTRRVEEDIASFRRWLEALISSRRSGDMEVSVGESGRVYIAEAGQIVEYLRFDVRHNLDRFAASARLALDDLSTADEPPDRSLPHDQELRWLLERFEEWGVDRAAITIHRPIKDIEGIDSLRIVQLLAEARRAYGLEDRWTLSEFYEGTVEQVAAYLATRRPV